MERVIFSEEYLVIIVVLVALVLAGMFVFVCYRCVIKGTGLRRTFYFATLVLAI